MTKTKKIPAVHPHWTGVLVFSPDDSRVRLEPFGSLGKYEQNRNNVTIKWDKFPKEEFILFDDICVQKNHINSISSIDDLNMVRASSEVMKILEVAIYCNRLNAKLYMRPGGSDYKTYNQIFSRGEYEFECLPKNAKMVVDIGANIGLAALYFSEKYPDAKIISVEPEQDNFCLLGRNTQMRHSKITIDRTAIWDRDGTVNLRTHDETGRSLDSWGVQVTDGAMGSMSLVPSLTLDSLFRKHSLNSVDILKVDVEGAELEIFSAASRDWKKIVKYMIIETHDRFKPGCEAAVRAAMDEDFVQVAGDAELQVFARKELAFKA